MECYYLSLSEIPSSGIHLYYLANIFMSQSRKVHMILAMIVSAWWRHLIEIFSAWLALCAGNSPVAGEPPSQRPVTRSFGVFFDLRLNKQLGKQWRRWWFETPARSLWRHINGDYEQKYPFPSLYLCQNPAWRQHLSHFFWRLASQLACSDRPHKVQPSGYFISVAYPQ